MAGIRQDECGTDITSKRACVHRFGDHVAGSAPFWQEVQKREEGAVITLLKCKATGQTILAGQLCTCNTSVHDSSSR